MERGGRTEEKEIGEERKTTHSKTKAGTVKQERVGVADEKRRDEREKIMQLTES